MSKPKFLIPVANADETAPASVTIEYVKKGDGGKAFWQLDLEGAAPVARVAEFRQSNTELRGKLEEFVSQLTGKPASDFKGIELDELAVIVEASAKANADALAAAKKAGKGTGKDGEKTIDEIVAERTKAMQDAHKTEMEKLRGERDSDRAELSRVKIDSAVIAEATKHGLLPGAHEDIAFRAARCMRLEDGKVVIYEPDGKTKRFSAKDGSDMGIEEWAAEQVEKSGHLFSKSAGAGGQGGQKRPGNGGGPVVNPWAPGKENLTQQMQMYAENPSQAVAMAREHGVEIAAP